MVEGLLHSRWRRALSTVPPLQSSAGLAISVRHPPYRWRITVSPSLSLVHRRPGPVPAAVSAGALPPCPPVWTVVAQSGPTHRRSRSHRFLCSLPARPQIRFSLRIRSNVILFSGKFQFV